MIKRAEFVAGVCQKHFFKTIFWSSTMKLSLIASALVSFGIGLSGAAHAINVGINIGTPAPVTVASPAPVIVASWHGDRYYDGHRYWERGE